jgi:hypothetical protein
MDNVLIKFPEIITYYCHIHTFAKTNTSNNTGFLLNEQLTSVVAQKQAKLNTKYTRNDRNKRQKGHDETYIFQ